MGRKILRVSLDLLLNAVCRDDRKRPHHPFVTCDGIPGDIKIVSMHFDPISNPGVVNFIVESSEFNEVPCGHHLMTIEPKLTCYTDLKTYLEIQAERKQLGVLDNTNEAILGVDSPALVVGGD